jgi:hypothetical protein
MSIDLYIQSVEARAAISVCAAADSAYATAQKKLDAWMVKHSAALKSGEDQAKAQGMLNAKLPNVMSFATMKAKILSELPTDDQHRRCSEIVEGLK